MDGTSLLLTFSAGLAFALVFGYVAARLHLTPIIGYLLAGIVVGPFTPGVVVDRAIAEQLAEIGVILLLFGVGLRFHLRELVAVWRIAVPGALLQSALSTAALAVMLHAMGWTWTPGIILGMSISVASTVVMTLVLAESNDLRGKIGHIAIGWTVVEDIISVALLLVLPIVFAPGGNGGQGVAAVLGIAGLKIGGLVAAVAVLGKWLIPWGLERVARTRSRELFTLATLVIAVGIAVGSAKVFGVSMALGAFLAGLSVSRSEFAVRAANDAMPMRDAFAVLFFVSAGMLFDPRSLTQAPLTIAVVLFAVIVVKPASAALTVRLLGQPVATAIPVGAAFAQVGEFSFILGTAAHGLGLVDKSGWNALVAASMISISLNPWFYRRVCRLVTAGKTQSMEATTRRRHIDPDRCILVGFGPVGKIVHQILTGRRAKITVVDLNVDTVRNLREKGHAAVFGDVLQPGTLVEAGIETAGSLILSADVRDAADVIAQARLHNPELRIYARCSFLRDAPALRRAGASIVAAGEAEVGVALAEAVTAADQMASGDSADYRETIRQSLYETNLSR